MEHTPWTILIIDDDDDDKDLFCQGVSRVDATLSCHRAADAEDALAKLKSGSEHPDLIFLDLNMPRMSGKQFLRVIKSIDSLKHIPIVIYSSSDWEKDVAETMSLGASHYITKPILLTQLSKEIQRVVEIERRRLGA